MRLNTIQKLYNTLKYEWPEIEMAADIMEMARKPIDEMLSISEKLKL